MMEPGVNKLIAIARNSFAMVVAILLPPEAKVLQPLKGRMVSTVGRWHGPEAFDGSDNGFHVFWIFASTGVY